MVVTAAGYELARVTLLGDDEAVLLDQYVRPLNPVLDYVTEFSGILPEHLGEGAIDLVDARARVMQHVSDATILVGHSLENDLGALRLLHNRVLDTAVLFIEDTMNSFAHKPRLRNIAARFLDMIIQDGSHNSHDDALASLRLAKLKIERGPAFGQHAPSTEPLVCALERAEKCACTLIDRPSALQQLSAGKADLVPAATDADAVRAAQRLLARRQRNERQFVWLQLRDLASDDDPVRGDTEADAPTDAANPDARARFDRVSTHLASIFESLAPDSLMVVISGHAGNPRVLQRLGTEASENPDDASRQQLLETTTQRMRLGSAYFCLR